MINLCRVHRIANITNTASLLTLCSVQIHGKHYEWAYIGERCIWYKLSADKSLTTTLHASVRLHKLYSIADYRSDVLICLRLAAHVNTYVLVGTFGSFTSIAYGYFGTIAWLSRSSWSNHEKSWRNRATTEKYKKKQWIVFELLF